MAQVLPYALYAQPLPQVAPPRGFRTLPVAHPHEGGTYLSPAGLMVNVMDVVEDEKRYRRLILSRPSQWPTAEEVDLSLRLFLGAGRPYRITQIFGTGPLTLFIEHCVDDQTRTVEQSEREKAELFVLIAKQNERRAKLTSLPQALKLQTPEGWRRRPGPTGPVFDDRAGLQVVVSEEMREDDSRWAVLSVSRVDRMPTEQEARHAADAFFGVQSSSQDGDVHHLNDERAAERKILFVTRRVRLLARDRCDLTSAVKRPGRLADLGQLWRLQRERELAAS